MTTDNKLVYSGIAVAAFAIRFGFRLFRGVRSLPTQRRVPVRRTTPDDFTRNS
jgi:hypothetical protein